MPANILLLFHCDANTGYAIGKLEAIFDQAARRVAQSSGQVHYAYRSLEGGFPEHLLGKPSDVTSIRYRDSSNEEREAFSRWLRIRKINLVLGFDLPINAPILGAIRNAGVGTILSYWGASISGLYPWYAWPLRRVQYVFARHKPDHYIFESVGMLNRALWGAAIPRSHTSISRLGVDCTKYAPDLSDRNYAYKAFNIPRQRKIVFFSGHMEPRKGVHVLLEAFLELIQSHEAPEAHLLLLGNRPEDELRLGKIIEGTRAHSYVTFGGYRNDVERIHHSVALGVISSTGWDSFTMSSVELASSGVPLIVSDLPGLSEAVVPQVTGEIVRANDPQALKATMLRLLNDENTCRRYGEAARSRVIHEYSQEQQIQMLSDLMQRKLSRL